MGTVFGLGTGWNANAARFGEEVGYTPQEISGLIGIAMGLGVSSAFVRLPRSGSLWAGIGIPCIAELRSKISIYPVAD